MSSFHILPRILCKMKIPSSPVDLTCPPTYSFTLIFFLGWSHQMRYRFFHAACVLCFFPSIGAWVDKHSHSEVFTKEKGRLARGQVVTQRCMSSWCWTKAVCPCACRWVLPSVFHMKKPRLGDACRDRVRTVWPSSHWCQWKQELTLTQWQSGSFFLFITLPWTLSQTVSFSEATFRCVSYETRLSFLVLAKRSCCLTKRVFSSRGVQEDSSAWAAAWSLSVI